MPQIKVRDVFPEWFSFSRKILRTSFRFPLLINAFSLENLYHVWLTLNRSKMGSVFSKYSIFSFHLSKIQKPFVFLYLSETKVCLRTNWMPLL